MMKKITLFICLLMGMTINAQSNITFSVDMTGQTFTQAYVNGSFNDWNGTSNPLTNMGGGIWEATLPLADGEYEYKFTYDNWAGQDSFTQGDVCTITNNGYTNRRLVVAGTDQTLATAPFNGCAESASNPGPHNITFIIDVSGYAGSSLGNGVTINGEWNAWCGNCNPLTDQGGGIWSVTLPLNEKAFQFKFTMGNWADQEMFTAGAPQTATGGGFTNRYLQVDRDKTINFVWNAPLQTLGLNDSKANISFKAYPNPTQDSWIVKTKNVNISSVQVYDILGKNVLSMSPNASDVKIDATKLSKGLYFVTLRTEAGSESLKLIKN